MCDYVRYEFATQTPEPKYRRATQFFNSEGKRLHCRGHMCMSPWFIVSYDGFLMCNGCHGQVYVPKDLESFTDMTQPPVLVWPTDTARELTPVELSYNE